MIRSSSTSTPSVLARLHLAVREKGRSRETRGARFDRRMRRRGNMAGPYRGFVTGAKSIRCGPTGAIYQGQNHRIRDWPGGLSWGIPGDRRISAAGRTHFLFLKKQQHAGVSCHQTTLQSRGAVRRGQSNSYGKVGDPCGRETHPPRGGALPLGGFPPPNRTQRPARRACRQRSGRPSGVRPPGDRGIGGHRRGRYDRRRVGGVADGEKNRAGRTTWPARCSTPVGFTSALRGDRRRRRRRSSRSHRCSYRPARHRSAWGW